MFFNPLAEGRQTMFKKRCGFFLIACAFILVAACSDTGGTGPVQGNGIAYYVSPSGNDSGAGTAADPWKTLGKATQTVGSGDTVMVRAGTYNELVVPVNSGTSDSPIVYMAYPGEAPVIDGTGVAIPAGWGGLFTLINVSHITVDGFTVQNAGTDNNHTGILVDNSSNVTVKNCYTYNTVSSGIGVWDSGVVTLQNNEVELACNDGEQECITVAGTEVFTVCGNEVHHSGPGSNGGEGIDIKDGSSLGDVYGNTVHDIVRLGIYVDSWDKQTDFIAVHNNLVYNTGDDGFALAAEAGGLLSNIGLYNNIAWGNANSGLTVAGWGEPTSHPMSNINIYNNTFVGNGSAQWGTGISVENPEADFLIISNNLLSQNTTAQILVESSGTGLQVDHNLYWGSGNPVGTDYVEEDPLLVNPGSGDCHLTGNSPAIDKGSASLAPSTDYDGNSRPQGSGYDIGAFEYSN